MLLPLQYTATPDTSYGPSSKYTLCDAGCALHQYRRKKNGFLVFGANIEIKPTFLALGLDCCRAAAAKFIPHSIHVLYYCIVRKSSWKSIAIDSLKISATVVGRHDDRMVSRGRTWIRMYVQFYTWFVVLNVHTW